jgi:hypothetical protein
VRSLILDNERQKSWLIFYSHDVQDTPSRFGCTPELLEFAVSCALQTSARILTVAEVVASLAHSPDNARVARVAFSRDLQKESLLKGDRVTNQE